MDTMIKIDNLSFRYPDGQPALSNINLTVRRGEAVALIGPNGAGKSTLILHLNGLLHRNGAVAIGGRTVDGASLRWVRQQVGLVFQNPDDQLFSPTVFDDVAFGPMNLGYPEDRVRREVATALERVGMTGYEGRSPHHLSIGEKKRIALATVLAMDPAILALDEPTSSLDPKAKWALIELLRRLPMTKIIASHDMALVRATCPRTVVLDHGQLVADGATADILADRPLLVAHGLAPAGAGQADDESGQPG
ncbi:MAG: ABC transporter ATP-binding protein [Chloroflexota bacterium]